MMRNCSVLLVTLLLLVGAETQPVQAQQEIPPNVYQIIAKECDLSLPERSLTGFLVNDVLVGDEEVDGIVTALHGVAGCGSVEASGVDLASVKLELIAVDIDRDVALLIITTSPNPLQQQAGLMAGEPVQPSQPIYVVGHPYGRTDQVQTTMQLRSNPVQRLQLLVPAGGEFAAIRQRLLNRSSPSLEIDVLDIQGTLVPGYSGAPIFNNTHQLIGVANGGLKGGGTEFVWAIPWRDICWTALNQTSPVDIGSCPDSDLTQTRLNTLAGENPDAIFAFPQSSDIKLTEEMIRLEVRIGQGANPIVLEQLVLSNKEASYLLPIPPGTDLTGAAITIRNQESTAQEVLATGQVSSVDSSLDSLNTDYEFYIRNQAGNLILIVFPPSILRPPTFEMHGHVIDRETGVPVSDAIVSVSSVTTTIKSGMTDSIGDYVFADIDTAYRGKNRLLQVKAEGYVNYSQNISLGPIPVANILLTPNTLVRPPGSALIIGGKVFKSGTKDPIPSARVTVFINHGGSQEWMASGRTVSDGSYILPVDNVQAVGQYGIITIEATGFQTHTLNTQLFSIVPLPDIPLIPEVAPTPAPSVPSPVINCSPYIPPLALQSANTSSSNGPFGWFLRVSVQVWSKLDLTDYLVNSGGNTYTSIRWSLVKPDGSNTDRIYLQSLSLSTSTTAGQFVSWNNVFQSFQFTKADCGDPMTYWTLSYTGSSYRLQNPEGLYLSTAKGNQVYVMKQPGPNGESDWAIIQRSGSSVLVLQSLNKEN